jgi:hypothetical protein
VVGKVNILASTELFVNQLGTFYAQRAQILYWPTIFYCSSSVLKYFAFVENN